VDASGIVGQALYGHRSPLSPARKLTCGRAPPRSSGPVEPRLAHKYAKHSPIHKALNATGSRDRQPVLRAARNALQ